MTERFLSTQEAADRMNIPRHRVLKLIREDGLPAFKDKLNDFRAYLIDESELIRWMDGRRIRRQ
jgi:excisionase family DNA binding protein